MAHIPTVVRATGPSDTPTYVMLCKQTWNEAIRDGENDKIGQYMGLVQTGALHIASGRGLERAHTLYRGLERRLGEAANGENHYAYIVPTRSTYTYLPKVGMREEPAPVGCVFVVFVEFPPCGDPKLESWEEEAGLAVDGMIYDWMWVLADRWQHDQPSDLKMRFKEQCWTRQ